ncbi:MAG: sulfite exporter TauE/SafE family protein, partial [Nitratireductor sp.]
MPLPDFDLSLAILLGTVLVGGIARGMSGFGTGMIVVPVAAALYGPKAALVIVVLIDTLPIIPVTIPALKVARWREVLPVLAGLGLLLPVGIQILKWGDPTVLRWLIC